MEESMVASIRDFEHSNLDERHKVALRLVDAFIIDFGKRLLTRREARFDLSEKEVGMLRLLAAHPGETVSREKFLDVALRLRVDHFSQVLGL